MSEQKKNPSQPQNVVSMPLKCVADGCKSKPSRLSFCPEHFMWFKEGLISREGHKARDFDKKHQAFMQRQMKKAS